ncbi:pf02656 domain containing protein [Rutstroemia sp. NJR-2017a WRK4]|nr:pf02656 domain containing protein [Rutstroemia sp. NJR-2017a WRK4]
MAETSDHRQAVDQSDELHEVSSAERDLWESTELSQIRRNYTRASSTHALGPGPGSTAPARLFGKAGYSISKFWRHQVSVTVDHATCRDHLALERTFLAYLRTSLAMSVMGVSIAQLLWVLPLRLQHSPTPNHVIGFFVLGKPLACICQVAAITTLLIGLYRSWRHQHKIVRGKALTGGFEVIIVAGGLFLIFLTFLVLLIAVDITKEHI